MEFVIKISQFLLSLSLLIVLHELGHFIPAKAFKTRVEKFYLFFDIKYSLFKKKIGETVYGIGWLPLGGYVKIAGMIDESMDKEQMKRPPQPWEFRSKPAWQRLIIMLGGVTVNFILAYIIYVYMAFGYGDTEIEASSLKGGYQVENPLLQELGFKTGDKILAINDTKIVNYSDITSNIIGAEKFEIERNGEIKTIDLPEDFLGRLSDNKEGGLFEIRIPFMVGRIPDSSQNSGAGLKRGDIITAVDGQDLKYYDEVAGVLKNFKGQTVQATILRDDKTLTKELKVSNDGKFEIFPGADEKRFVELGYFNVVRTKYGFVESIGAGGTRFVNEIKGYGEQLKAIFNPKTGAISGVGGFYAIYNIFPDTWSWEFFWKITAFLSIMLGVLNLLPIPALDGGHVMFLLYEMISGKAPSEKFMERAQMVGFIILIALVLFANGNDIFKALFK